MAQGKMSPRQKMINMMYLVLLALLALNVSAEVLQAFVIIKGKLNTSALEARSNSIEFMNSMKKTIDEEVKNEGKTTNVGLKDTLDIIKQETGELIGVLNNHIEVLTDSIAGRNEKTNKLEKIDDTETNHQYWMGVGDAEQANGGRGDGHAYRLRESLNDYADFIVKMYNTQVKDPALQLKLQDELMAVDPDPSETQYGQEMTWEQFIFSGPVIANMAMLEKMKLDIYEKEKKLLDLLNTRLGVAAFKADKVIDINAPVSTIVPAGLQFQTKLYVAMSSSQIQPKFSSPNGSVKQEEDGGALLTIGASGSRIPKGKNQAKQSYSYTIQVPKATGGFETISKTAEFTVRKPEIVVTSAAIQILYELCGNDVNIDVPALGEQYNPRVTVSSGDIKQSPKSNKTFRIVPTGRKCVVTVKSVTNGQTLTIGNVNYKVIKPPKPTIDMRINNKKPTGAPVPKTSRVQVRLSPDADFASSLPNDARYAISDIEVKAQLSLGPPVTVNRIKTSGQDATKPINVALGTRVRQARPGTTVYIILNEIRRINFQKRAVADKRFSEVERTLSLVVK